MTPPRADATALTALTIFLAALAVPWSVAAQDPDSGAHACSALKAMTAEEDSSSEFKTGKSEFDSADLFPAAPGALGCSKPD